MILVTIKSLASTDESIHIAKVVGLKIKVTQYSSPKCIFEIIWNLDVIGGSASAKKSKVKLAARPYTVYE